MNLDFPARQPPSVAMAIVTAKTIIPGGVGPAAGFQAATESQPRHVHATR